MKIKYKMYLYNILYLVGSIIIKIFNPCKIRLTPSGITCENDYGLCCNRCRHLSDKGCAVKALSCKLWLCEIASYKHPKIAIILKKLTKIAIRYNIYRIRNLKLETRLYLNKIYSMQYFGAHQIKNACR